MATTTNSFYFRRRRIGRAASPPTWACYEQIRYDEGGDYSDSDSDSCSEDEEDYSHIIGGAGRRSDEVVSDGRRVSQGGIDTDDIDMDMGDEDDGDEGPRAQHRRDSADSMSDNQQAAKDVKGKQKAVDPEPEQQPQPPIGRRGRQAKRRERQPVYSLRPILTIQRSQGFVWNQDLFVPPYIKDRYIASTSPPNSHGFISTSVSSTNSAMTDYEVEVVEIRIKDGELEDIIP
ncbi:hypothetical protein CC1G_06240 [Coprinopsis cinerea okayama7|uniref:Uncharacterized protein n=1 Tax=Coprinopsis cinerea (strain Okayama-7 / 130 / ATCC MYA-4618 / FGSC 9003) TaxID=240176 RepID=A8NVC3_COPC7|nr:hypothetical protein CC1G_06240 [Coprinopsis cinerea okayama7\|eukprot:XP_001836653.1 hypothetical protein CC1G_06240 [Coprinopsis cinerea okayama7\